MPKFFQKILVFFICMFILSAAIAFGSDSPIWNDLLQKYLADEAVKSLIFVQHIEGPNAQVKFYKKDENNSNAWKLLVQGKCFVGKKGISSDKHERDWTTPSGNFGVIEAIGIKPNPGTNLPYRMTNKDLFCSDRHNETFNKIVSKKKSNHVCDKKCAHLYNISPNFNYAIFPDYNKKQIFAKGGGVFLHCFGPKTYTHGCIAISEENMKRILQLADRNVRICIFPK